MLITNFSKMLPTIILATITVSLISLIGILLFWRRTYSEKLIKHGISLAAEALLGVVFLNIIPELFSHSETERGALNTETKS